MIKANLKHGNSKIAVSIPTSWRDVSFLQYYRIIQLGDKADVFDIYAILLNLDAKTIERVSLESFEQIANLCAFIKDKSAFTQDDLARSILFKGQTWTYYADMGNAPIGCYKDWQQFELKNYVESDPLAILPRTLAHFLRPVGEEYDHTKIDERAELFMQLDCVTALQLFNFFLRNLKGLNLSLRAYTASLMWMRKRQELITLLRLAFTLPITALPVAIYCGWMRLQSYRFMRSIRFYFTKKA
jgi:hypothetical protein